MAAKNNSTSVSTNDLESTGRLHDGFAFVVYIRDQSKPARLHDADPISAVTARWLEGRKDPQNGLVIFSGARRAFTMDDEQAGKIVTEIGPFEGAGAVLAASIVGIRYASPADDHAEEALEAVRALHEIQGAAMREAAGGDGDGDGSDDPSNPAGASMGDDDLGGEEFHVK